MTTVKLQNVLCSVLPGTLASGNVELLEFNTSEDGFDKVDQSACLKYHDILMAVGHEFNFVLPAMSILLKAFQDLDRCLEYRLTHTFKTQTARNTFYRFEAEKLKLLTSYAIRLCRRSEVSRSPNMNILRDLYRAVSASTTTTSASSTTPTIGHDILEVPVPLPDYPEEILEVPVSLPDYPEESDCDDDHDCDVVEIASSEEMPANDVFESSEKGNKPIDFERQGKKKRKEKRKHDKEPLKSSLAVLKRPALKKPAAKPAASRKEASADGTSKYRIQKKYERGQHFFQIRTSAGSVLQVTSKQCFGRIEVAKEVSELLLRLFVLGVDVAEVKTFRKALLFQGAGEICGHAFTLEGLASEVS